MINSFAMNRPTPDPSKEGNGPVRTRQFPSWEGSGVGLLVTNCDLRLAQYFMKRTLLLFAAALFAGIISTRAAEPLRVFIRAGPKTHGPNQHDHPRFLREWTPMLNERGLKADGRRQFPETAQLENTAV